MVLTRTPLTKEGQAKLEEELQYLKNNERPAIIKAIAEARAHGDLSENAEYTSAKEKQRFIEGRIQELENILSVAEIIDPTRIDAGGRCIFGSYVDVEDADGKKISYRIVSRHESNIEEGLMSVDSPVGRALIGKFSGDMVLVETPSGAFEYKILAVRYE